MSISINKTVTIKAFNAATNTHSNVAVKITAYKKRIGQNALVYFALNGRIQHLSAGTFKSRMV